MKTNIKKDLHTKSLAELRSQLIVVKEEKRVLNLDREMGKLKNTSSINQKRVEIAVISTIIKEKTTEAEVKSAKELISETKDKGGKK